MVADDVVVRAGEFEDRMVARPHSDFRIAVEDVGFAFKGAEGRIADRVRNAVG